MKKAIGKNTDGSWNGQVTFTFEGCEAVTFDSGRASAECEQSALAHGWLARLGDMAAIPKSDGKGNVIAVTEAMRREAVLAGVTHYESGATDWNLKAATRPAPQNPVILAVAAKFSLTYEQASAKIANDMLGE